MYEKSKEALTQKQSPYKIVVPPKFSAITNILGFPINFQKIFF